MCGKVLSKKEKTIEWLKKHSQVLSCTHCHAPLFFEQSGLICENGHRFDLNKYGTLFMAKKSVDTLYDRDLFQARRHILTKTSLYYPFYQWVDQVFAPIIQQKTSVLDAGSGEGTHLRQMMQRMTLDSVAIGVDLAKSGIQLSSDYNGEQLNVVADLAKLPIKTESIDLILSLLSPANYAEFKRVLQSGGHLLKVSPHQLYLTELRQTVARVLGKDEGQPAVNDVKQQFEQHFILQEQAELVQQVTIDTADYLSLIRMTPLGWQLTTEQLEEVALGLPQTLTVAFNIMVGIKK